ncbi:MAG: hypothetical protein BWY31_04424 [Lentisphaerae bacterium ADurb.Bin242]|nr:MAG: hypothetical protein BWY31_04424 [Lentisphaerae bacterium ADurb.Bin242]
MKKAIYQQKGDSIDYIPSSAVAAGDVIFFGDVAAVAKLDIPAGSLGSLAAVGMFNVEKDGNAIADGVPVYYNAVTGASATNSGTDKVMGVAVAAAVAGDAYVRVLLNAGKKDSGTAYSIATGVEVTAGTDNAKIVTAKAIKDAGIKAPAAAAAAIPNVAEAGADSANIISALNALLAAVRTHGVIAAE